ncbi:MAG: hypothetical protein ACP6IY_09745 [Promethearchaeia archaeon]
MKKQILILVLGIALLFSVSAMYPGETYYKDLTTEIENLHNFECNLTLENYDLEGLIFLMNKTGYIISLDTNFRPDNITVNCLLNNQKYISTTNSGSSKYCSNKKYNTLSNRINELESKLFNNKPRKINYNNDDINLINYNNDDKEKNYNYLWTAILILICGIIIFVYFIFKKIKLKIKK